MKELIERLRRDIRRLRDEVGPCCSDDGINTLMDVHDELLRTVRKIEYAQRNAEARESGGAQSRDGQDGDAKRRSGASSA